MMLIGEEKRERQSRDYNNNSMGEEVEEESIKYDQVSIAK